MAQRFTDQVGIQQQNLSTGFQQGSNSLLNRLQAFSRSTDNLIGTVEAQRGEDEAQKAISEGKPFKKKEASIAETLFTGGVATAQYNQSLENAYLAGIGNDAKEAINAIEAENTDNITQFNDKSQGYINGVLKTVDPSVQGQVSEFLNNQVSNSRLRVHRNTIKKNKADAAAESTVAVTSFGNEAARLSREGNQVAAAEQMIGAFTTIDAMVLAGDLKADKAVLMKREIERESSEQIKRKEFDDIIDNDGLEAAFTELNNISNEVPKGWAPDEWDSFVSSQQADLRQSAIRMSQVDAQKNIQTSREVSNLKIKSNTGVDLQGNPVDPSSIIQDADKFFSEGKINGNTRASIISSVINSQKGQVSDVIVKDKVAAKLAGAAEIPLTQKEIDLAWDEDYSKPLNDLPVEVKGAAITNFVNSTKIVPTQVLKQVNNNLNSGVPELVIESASLMDRLDGVRGIPETNFTPNDRAFAQAVVNLSQNMDPVEAVQLARQNTNPNDKARVEARENLLKEDKKSFLSSTYKDVVENAFDPLFGSTTVDPISADQMTKEYGILFEQHFVAGMGKDAAQEKALQLLQRNWKDSSAVGPTRAMKYRPEDYYDVAGNTGYIATQLHKDVIKDNIFPFEFSKNDMRLISDDKTAREAATGKPSYMVMIDRGEEGLFPIAGSRFVPDVQAEVKRQQSLNKEKLDKERKIDRKETVSDALSLMRSF